MPYCYNCGEKIDIKDRKCDKCSYPIGHVVTAHDDGIYTVKRKSNAFIRGIKESLQFVFGMMKAPIDNIMTASKNMRNTISFGVLGLLLMVNGALFVWIAKLIEAVIKRVIEKPKEPGVMGAYSADLGGISSLVSFNYGKAFFNGVILLAIVAILQFALLYFISKYVFKAKVNHFSIWKISISAFIPYFSSVIVAFILRYFNGSLALLVLVLGLAASAVCLYKALEQELSLSCNKVMLTMLGSYGIWFIVVTIVVKYNIDATVTGFFTKQTLRSLFYIYTMN